MQNTIYLIVVFLAALAIAAAVSRCPPGKPKVNCFANPCTASSCAGDPGATCTPYYCGGCYAIWRDANGALADCTVKCPPDQPEVQCFIDPCQDETCPAYPNAICVSNYCGGCNFQWYDANGAPVQCSASS